MPKLKTATLSGHQIRAESNSQYCQCNVAKPGEPPKSCGRLMKKLDAWTWVCKSHGEMY